MSSAFASSSLSLASDGAVVVHGEEGAAAAEEEEAAAEDMDVALPTLARPWVFIFFPPPLPPPLLDLFVSLSADTVMTSWMTSVSTG